MVFCSTLSIFDTSIISRYSGLRGGWTVVSTDCPCTTSSWFSLSSTTFNLSNIRLHQSFSAVPSKYDIIHPFDSFRLHPAKGYVVPSYKQCTFLPFGP